MKKRELRARTADMRAEPDGTLSLRVTTDEGEEVTIRGIPPLEPRNGIRNGVKKCHALRHVGSDRRACR